MCASHLWPRQPQWCRSWSLSWTALCHVVVRCTPLWHKIRLLQQSYGDSFYCDFLRVLHDLNTALCAYMQVTASTRCRYSLLSSVLAELAGKHWLGIALLCSVSKRHRPRVTVSFHVLLNKLSASTIFHSTLHKCVDTAAKARFPSSSCGCWDSFNWLGRVLVLCQDKRLQTTQQLSLFFSSPSTISENNTKLQYYYSFHYRGHFIPYHHIFCLSKNVMVQSLGTYNECCEALYLLF